MAKAFLAVAGMKASSNWSDASSDNLLRSKDVIRWMNQSLGESLEVGSYDSVTRKYLTLPVNAGLVINSAGLNNAAQNNPLRCYALAPETAALVRTFGTDTWLSNLEEFRKSQDELAGQRREARLRNRIPIKVGSQILLFGPGEHNELQKKIIEDFLPIFGYGAEVLYVGDAEDRLAFVEEQQLSDLGFFELKHGRLPDVLAYSRDKNWLYLVEAVHAANPISSERKDTLERLAANCTAEIIYVTAFLTRKSFSKFAGKIAWETEVWIAESPDHLIHFNGDRFLGPHKN